jgi:hypothetical protein
MAIGHDASRRRLPMARFDPSEVRGNKLQALSERPLPT